MWEKGKILGGNMEFDAYTGVHVPSGIPISNATQALAGIRTDHVSRRSKTRMHEKVMFLMFVSSSRAVHAFFDTIPHFANAASSLTRASTHCAPCAVCSFFQNGAWVFK